MLSSLIGINRLDWFNVLISIFILTILLLKYFISSFDVFSKLGIEGPKPVPLLGTLHYYMKEGLRLDLTFIRKYGRVFGTFEGVHPVLVTSDPEMIKQIAIKEFDSFANHRRVLINAALRKMLGVAKNEEWKTLRNVISPAFSNKKMQQLMPVINSCTDNLIRKIDMLAENGQMCEVRQLFSTFTMDVVAQAHFGIAVEEQVDTNSTFVQEARKMFDVLTIFQPKMLLYLWFPFLVPLLDFIGVTVFPKDSVEYFVNLVKNILQVRSEKRKDQQQTDLLQALVSTRGLDSQIKAEFDENNNKISKPLAIRKKLTREEIIANSVMFLIGGNESIARAMSWVAYSLSVHQDVQEKLHKELSTYLSQNEAFTYESVMNFQYLDQVINETMRLYPPGMRTDRVCNETCQIGKYQIPKGMIINFSILGVHYDEEYWPEPTKFDPERFSMENRLKIVPYTFIPFGVGPRNCVAMRMAMMEIKLAVAQLVANFQILPCEKTEIPIKLQNTTFTAAANGIWVAFRKR